MNTIVEAKRCSLNEGSNFYQYLRNMQIGLIGSMTKNEIQEEEKKEINVWRRQNIWGSTCVLTGTQRKENKVGEGKGKRNRRNELQETEQQPY